MKSKNLNVDILHSTKLIGRFFVMVTLLFVGVSCDDNELPGVGSIPDLTPPSANFSLSQSEGDYLTVSFSNLSNSATDYLWDFGDGTTSTEKDPTHTYTGEGTVTISLTATDKLNQTSTYSSSLELVEPIIVFTPEISNPGFDIEGADSYRDGWRNGDLGGVLQITGSPIHDGVKAGKFPSDGSRIAYQLVTVQPEKDYVVSFYYTMKTSPVGSLRVSILDGHVTDSTTVVARTIGSFTGTDQTSANDYVLGSISFNSGSSAEVAILIGNSAAESRIDTFTIVEN